MVVDARDERKPGMSAWLSREETRPRDSPPLRHMSRQWRRLLMVLLGSVKLWNERSSESGRSAILAWIHFPFCS